MPFTPDAPPPQKPSPGFMADSPDMTQVQMSHEGYGKPESKPGNVDAGSQPAHNNFEQEEASQPFRIRQQSQGKASDVDDNGPPKVSMANYIKGPLGAKMDQWEKEATSPQTANAIAGVALGQSAGALPKAFQGLLGRKVVEAGQGAAMNPDNPGLGAAEGVGIGSLLGVAPMLGAGAKAAYKAIVPGSAEVNKSKLAQLLTGKTVTMQPDQFSGLDPDVDRLVDKAKSDFYETGQHPASDSLKYVTGGGTDPATGQSPPIKVPAQDLENIRSALDSKATDMKINAYTSDSANKELNAVKGAANIARGTLHDVSPEADAFYNNWSSSLGAQKAMSAAGKEAASGSVLTGLPKMAAIPATEAVKGMGRSVLGRSTPGSVTLSDIMNAIHQTQQQQKNRDLKQTPENADLQR